MVMKLLMAFVTVLFDSLKKFLSLFFMQHVVTSQHSRKFKVFPAFVQQKIRFSKDFWMSVQKMLLLFRSVLA